VRAFVKTLFGDAWNIAGVALIVAVAGVLTAYGRADWAVIGMPVAVLVVVGWLAH
jgi:hypothetical protein